MQGIAEQENLCIYLNFDGFSLIIRMILLVFNCCEYMEFLTQYFHFINQIVATCKL